MFNPSSKVYSYTSVELKPNGENEVCTNESHMSCCCLVSFSARINCDLLDLSYCTSNVNILDEV